MTAAQEVPSIMPLEVPERMTNLSCVGILTHRNCKKINTVVLRYRVQG